MADRVGDTDCIRSRCHRRPDSPLLFVPTKQPTVNRSPTVDTLAVFVVVFALQTATALVGFSSALSLFVLQPPVTDAPGTVLTSVYAHGSLGHLLSNSIALVLAGLVVERRTTWLRFHLFFLVVGALAGVSQVVLTGLFGTPTGVLGASGAVFGLFGYLLAGNRVTATVFSRIRLSPRAQLVVFVLAAAVVTAATGQPGVALVAHFVGLLLGLLAGATRLLDA